jgi:hypothetical protein
MSGLDMAGRYRVSGYGGVAFYLLGHAVEETYEGDYLVCDDEECDHMLSEMCWAEGDTSLSLNPDMVRAVMVGDDTEHIIDIDDLTPIADEDYCHECGQIGCTADGR